jgi:hypothetical protein
MPSMLGRLEKEQKKHLVRHGGRHTEATLAETGTPPAVEPNPPVVEVAHPIGIILIPLPALAHIQMTTYISQCLFLITRLPKRRIGLGICQEASRGLT